MTPLDAILKQIANAEQRRSNALKRCDQISAERWRLELERLEVERQRVALELERENDVQAMVEKLNRHAWSGARWR